MTSLPNMSGFQPIGSSDSDYGHLSEAERDYIAGYEAQFSNSEDEEKFRNGGSPFDSDAEFDPS